MKRVRNQNHAVVIGVCAVYLFLAGFFAIRGYQYYAVHPHLIYQFPFSAEDIESITFYDRQNFQKKEIARETDILELVDFINHAEVEQMDIQIHRQSNISEDYLLFHLKDGSLFHCIFYSSFEGDRFLSYTDTIQTFYGGFESSISDLWNRMDYPVAAEDDVCNEIYRFQLAVEAKMDEPG